MSALRRITAYDVERERRTAVDPITLREAAAIVEDVRRRGSQDAG